MPHIYNNTTVINPVVEGSVNSRFHKGIPVNRIAEATHTEIKPVRIHETTDVPSNGRGERFDRSNGALTVYRPRLPEPPANHNGYRVGEGVMPATPDNDSVRRFNTDTTMHKGIPRQASGTINAAPSDRRNDSVPVFKAPVVAVRPGGQRSGSPAEVVRSGPDSANSQLRNPREIENPPATPNGNGIPSNSLVVRGRPNSVPQPRLDAPAVPGTAPVERNNSLLNRRQPAIAVPPPQTQTPAVAQTPVRRQPPVVQTQAPRSESVVIAPAASVPRQPDTRIYQAPPTIPRPQAGSFDQAPGASVPVFRAPAMTPPAPRIEMPRVEVRSAPVVQTPQPSVPGDRNNNLRQNR